MELPKYTTTDNITIVMEKISVIRQEETASAWQFNVTVSNDSHTQHKVTLAKPYWQKLTKKQVTPENLVKKSFEFLLVREPKESILNSFDLSLIAAYFPEYETEIKKQ